MTISVDIPEFVSIETSELGAKFGVGRVIEAWRGHIKVEWLDENLKPHIGIYSVLSNQINAARFDDTPAYGNFLKKCSPDAYMRCRISDWKRAILMRSF